MKRIKTILFINRLVTVLLLFSLVTIPTVKSSAQCWLSQLAKDLNSKTVPSDFQAFIKNSENAFDTYKILVNAQGISSSLRNDAVVLNSISELRQDAKFIEEAVGGEVGFNKFLSTSTKEDILHFRSFRNNIAAVSQELHLTALQRKFFYDAIAQLSKPASFINDFADDVEKLKKLIQNPNLVNSWEMLSDLPAGKIWVRQNTDILEKISSVDQTKQSSLREFYATFTPNGPYPTIRNGISFDKYGFIEFPEDAIAPIGNNRYVSETLDGAIEGSKKDYENAAKWFVDNNPNAQLATGGQGIVVNGEYYTMHHMQDGKTIMPILQSVHNTSHTGGASIIRNNLQGVFSIP